MWAKERASKKEQKGQYPKSVKVVKKGTFEFYKEVKFLILSRFEKIRLEIFELLENLHENLDDDNDNDL